MWSKAVAIGSICAVALGCLGLLALIALKGGPAAIGGAAWIQVGGFIGVLLTLLGVIGNQWITQQKLNGHLSQHEDTAQVKQAAVMLAAQQLVDKQQGGEATVQVTMTPKQEDPTHGA